MKSAQGRRLRPSAKPVEQHREWLQLFDTDGPFLSVPVVKSEWPNGLDRMESGSPRLISFVDEFLSWRQKPEAQHESWIRNTLTAAAQWDGCLKAGTEVPTRLAVDVPEHRTVIRPWGALFEPSADPNQDLPAALVFAAPPNTPLRAPSDGEWTASQIDRTAYALRATGVPIGIVTDGRWWAVVSATPGVTTASGLVDATLWREEPLLRDAFLNLIDVRRLISGSAEHHLPALFKASLLQQEEITEALGTQVRRAVELLVQAMSESKIDADREGRPDPLPGPPATAYDIAVTVMMRIVFLLFAEERTMLPIDRDLYRTSYAISPLLDELDARARDGEEDLANSSLTWHRFLATSSAIHDGATFEDLRMPAYGGSLFDPERFPELTARSENGSLALRINDRVMWHVLKAVQTERATGQLRRISFREIDVEQIGYIYEGLLGYTTQLAAQTVLGLKGKDGEEPEITFQKLAQLTSDLPADNDFAKALIAFLKEDQPSAVAQTPAQIKRTRSANIDESEARRLLLPVCQHDFQLVDELLPYFSLLRTDLRGLPLVIPPGGLLVAETPSRKNAGAHYTPRSLAEEVVEHTLQPLVFQPGPLQTAVESEWKPISSAEILDLNVADIAAGSGAFLVAAARYLAGKLVDAWHREGAIDLKSLSDDGARRMSTRAQREVIAHCLYGADINPMAVEMCKLSMWLVSMDPNKPFSFVDDKILCGNSLLGLISVDQLRYLHIDPNSTKNKQLAFTQDIEGPLRRATQLRTSIAASTVDDDDPQRSANHKTALLREAYETTAMLRDISDGVIAAGLRVGGRPGKALDESFENLAIAVLNAYPKEIGESPDRSMLDDLEAMGLTPGVDTDYERWAPLHWILEVPDVMESGGFDAIIGNPPFFGGQKITGAFGAEFRDWLVHQLAAGTKGSADMVAYFFLRAENLLNPRTGQLGLIATNTIAQGDTRDVGLKRMLDGGFTIHRAIQSATWPAATVNLEYAAVWGCRAPVPAEIPRFADTVPCAVITSLLEPEGRVVGDPVPLNENRGVAFIGSYVLGKGYVLTREKAEELFDLDVRNTDVVFPYLNGEDLNSRPDCSPSRFVINFHDWPQDRARQYPAPFELVERLVKPERQKGNIASRRDRWWQYAARAGSLYRALEVLEGAIAIVRVSKTVMPVLVPTGQIMSDSLVVFATDSSADLAFLSSSAHQAWAIKYGSGMRNDPRYTPSDVFETLPRPDGLAGLTGLGRELHETRGDLMLARGLGLTDVYNLVNSREVADEIGIDGLRELHVAIDRAVMAAYGWGDIGLDHGFHTYRQVERFTVCPAARIEILDRLLEENLHRAAGQGEQNLGSARKSAARAANKSQQVGEDLFGDELV